MKKKKNIILFLAIIIVLPALFINLGLQPVIDDEGIRAVVAFEMDYNKDYITPTLGEQLYFKKPPVYNWILIASKKLTNNFSEFTLRLPTVVFLLLFAFTIYYVLRKKFNKKFAFLVAFMFVTSARVLFYESLLGLIDMSYSWLIFVNFIIIYYYFRKEKYLHLFLLSYSLIAITFLMKGLTSVAFQGMTLLPFFIIEKRFKKLLSWQHFLGLLSFCLIAGSYYLAYYLKNPDSIEDLLRTIVFESTDKSAIGSGKNEIIFHILSFPTEVIYHFLPWTLLLIFLFRKGTIKTIRNNPFLRFCSVVFISNIIVYWLSPTTYARYLMPLIPLMFTVFTYFFLHELEKRTRLYIVFEKILIGAAVLLTISLSAIPYIDVFKEVNDLWVKISALFVIFSTAIYLLIKKVQWRIEAFIIFILLVRIGYNLIVVPIRGDETTWHGICKNDAIEAGKFTKGEMLYLHAGMNYKSYYYLEREREAPITYSKNTKSEGFHIIHDPKNKCKDCIKLKKIRITYNKHVLDLVKYKQKGKK